VYQAGFFRQAVPELYFSIDEKNRKIFADTSKSVKAGSENNINYPRDYTLDLYLVGYTL
jgi:hypothetical protein